MRPVLVGERPVGVHLDVDRSRVQFTIPDSLDSGVRVSELPSGVRVACDNIESALSAGFGVWCGVGSRHESHKARGLTHFVEHMLFRGTTSRTAKSVNRLVDSLGAEFSAYTSRESTVFYMRVPAVALEQAAELFADVICSPRFDSGDFELEREVIREELDAAIDTPDDLVIMNLMEACFPGHPLGWETLGTFESLEEINIASLRDHHRANYASSRLVVAGAGAVTPEQLTHFARMLPTHQVVERRHEEVPLLESAEVHAHRPIEQLHIAVGFRGPGIHDEDRTAMALLSQILGDGPSSRMYEVIRDSHGLAYSVASSVSTYSDTGTLILYAGTRPSKRATVIGLIDEIIADLACNGPTDEEFEVGKGALLGAMMLGADDIGSRMSRVGSSLLTRGSVTPMSTAVSKLIALRPEDIQRQAQRIADSPRVISTVGPS